MYQALRAGRMATSDESKLKNILVQTANKIKSISMKSTPAETGMIVYNIVSKVSGNADPYKKIKQKHIEEAKSIFPELEELVKHAEDRLLTAIKVAIAGNIIDLGVRREFNIVEDVRKILQQDFGIKDYIAFRSRLERAREILRGYQVAINRFSFY